MAIDPKLTAPFEVLHKNLLSDLKPIKVRRGKRRILVGFLLLATIIISAFIMGLFRPDFVEATKRGRFLVETISLILAVINGIISALWLTYPGEGNKSAVAGISFLGFIGIWIFSALFRAIFGPWSPEELTFLKGVTCQGSLLVCGLIALGALSLSLLSRGAPVHIISLVTTILGTSLAAAALVLQFHCPFDYGPHTFLFHVLPIPIILLLAIPLLSKAIKW